MKRAIILTGGKPDKITEDFMAYLKQNFSGIQLERYSFDLDSVPDTGLVIARTFLPSDLFHQKTRHLSFGNHRVFGLCDSIEYTMAELGRNEPSGLSGQIFPDDHSFRGYTDRAHVQPAAKLLANYLKRNYTWNVHGTPHAVHR